MQVMQAAFGSAKTGFEISIGLTGMLSLWLGILKIGERGGAINILSRMVAPFFSKIFPDIPKGHPAMGSIFMVNDPNLTAQFKGLIDLTQKIPVFNFNLNAARVNLYALNLVHDYPKMELSFNINTNMAGNSPDNLNGSLDIDNITINNQSKTLNIDKIRLNAENKNGVNNLTVESDYINGSIVGDYRYSTINSTINGIVKRYLPSLALKNGTTNNPHPNHVNFDFFLSNTNDISDVLELPYKLEKEASIKGYIDERSNQIYMEA